MTLSLIHIYTVRYIRLPDLLVEISAARANGTYRDYMKKLKKEKLLILDEWLLYPLKEAEARDVLEPVSYTHLDVYKRQAKLRNSKAVLLRSARNEENGDPALYDAAARLSELAKSLNDTTNIDTMRGIEAVSYTHLLMHLWNRN